MTLDEIGKSISAISPYPLIELRETPEHILATLGRPMSEGMAKFTFALSHFELEHAIYPHAIIDAHTKMASEELAARKTGLPSLKWG